MPPRSPSTRSAGARLERLGGGDPARAREGLAAGAGAEAEQVAGGEAGAGGRGLAAADGVVQRHQHRQRVGEVRGGRLHQDAALDRALVGDADLAVGEVAQAAVHQLGRPARGAERQVVGVDGQHREPAGRGVEGDTGAGHAEAGDDQVDLVGQASAARR